MTQALDASLRSGRLLVGLGLLAAAQVLAGCSAEQVRYAPLSTITPSSEAITASVYLVGDGGEVNPDREAVLAHLASDIEGLARGGNGPPVVVAFLGDNIYDEGAPPDPTREDIEKLAGQVRALGDAPNVRGIFVPGNHDWANGAPLEEGRAALARQRAWLDSLSTRGAARLLPSDGCPGPVAEDIGDVAHLVIIDTEWLIRAPEDGCGTPEAFYERLALDLRAHADRPVVVLSHHPLASGGPHAGNVSPFEKGPLVYYLAAKSGVGRQDLASGAYTAMVRAMEGAIAESGAPPLVYAGGHDHSLQVIRLAAPGQPRYQLVSGALSKTERARRLSGTRYATNGYGYMRLDFLGGRVRLVVFAREVSGGPLRAVFSCSLSQAAPEQECPEAPLVSSRP